MPTSTISGLLLWVMLVIAHWKMFAKAGEAGWKAIIPIYSDYVLFKLVWYKKSFFIYYGSIVGFVLFTIFSGQIGIDSAGSLVLMEASNQVFAVLAYVCTILILIYTVMLAIRTSFAYGKSALFAVGLLILPSIFSLIIGFGSAEYKGTPA